MGKGYKDKGLRQEDREMIDTCLNCMLPECNTLSKSCEYNARYKTRTPKVLNKDRAGTPEPNWREGGWEEFYDKIYKYTVDNGLTHE